MEGACRSGWERKYGHRGISTGFRLSVDRPPSQLSHRQREGTDTDDFNRRLYYTARLSVNHSNRIEELLSQQSRRTLAHNNQTQHRLASKHASTALFIAS